MTTQNPAFMTAQDHVQETIALIDKVRELYQQAAADSAEERKLRGPCPAEHLWIDEYYLEWLQDLHTDLHYWIWVQAQEEAEDLDYRETIPDDDRDIPF